MKRSVISFAGLALISGFLLTALSTVVSGATTSGEISLEPATERGNANASRIFLDDREAHEASVAHLMPEGTVSLLSQGAMQHGQFAWDDDGVPGGERIVFVDLRRQIVSVYRGGHEIGTAVMLYGKPGKDTPLGSFPVLRKVANYHSRTYDAPMPHSLFITNDGVALHGSDVRYGRATHGCIGLPPEFAKLLFQEMKIGDEVVVVFSDAGATEKLALQTGS